MPVAVIFLIQLIFGYVAWLLCFRAYILPWMGGMERAHAHRLIAAFHSFRFFGLVFILPGVVGPGLPHIFATYAAWGDFATGLLAMAALASFRIRALFWSAVATFNLVGFADLAIDYAHAIREGLPDVAGQLGGAYPIVIVYVPLLMITNATALVWLGRSLFGARDRTGALGRA